MVNNKDLYNEDELIAPQWLNEEFIENILKNNDVKFRKIIDFTITPGTTKSDHYSSIMFRIKANYNTARGEHKFKSMILKSMPELDGMKKEVLGELKIFDTELKMYAETLPKIESILRKYGDNTKLCAGLIYYSITPRQCLVFDDLTVTNYTTISNRQCSIEEVKMALLKLSKMQAVSYCLAQQKDTNVTSYKWGSFNSIDAKQFPMTRDGLKNLKRVLTKYEDLKEYVPHIEQVEENILDECTGYFNEYCNGKRDGIYVLAHGDFHLKNVMVHYRDDKLQDLMLLDYQISCMCSIAIDLFYATAMMFSPEMRRDHRDELLYYYFTNFQETLKLIEYKGHIPTLFEFQMELIKYRHWELYMILVFLMFNSEFTSEGGNLAKVLEDENYRKSIVERESFLNEMRVLLPRFLHKGYFES